MSFDLKMSQDVFQMRMNQIVDRCPSILDIHDDLCICDKSEKEHHSNQLNLIQVATNISFVFNSKKVK